MRNITKEDKAIMFDYLLGALHAVIENPKTPSNAIKMFMMDLYDTRGIKMDQEDKKYFHDKELYKKHGSFFKGTIKG